MVVYEWCIICKEVGAMYVMIGTIHAGLGLVSARLSGLWLQLSDIPMGMGVHLPVSAMVVWDRSNRRNSAYRDRFAGEIGAHSGRICIRVELCNWIKDMGRWSNLEKIG